jgi:voltage-gated potassium channel Kch
MGAGLGLTLTGITDERSWVTGGRIQLPLILGAFVMAEVTWFASAYWLTSQGASSSFSAPLTRIDTIYFSLTTYTTTGFGDISAHSQGSRVLASLEMITALFTLVVLVATAVTKAFTQGR